MQPTPRPSPSPQELPRASDGPGSAADVIEVRGLAKRYGSLAAVDGISFAVREGEVFGLVGPNGSGKTTTVECVQGLRRPDRGRVRVLGLDPARESRRLRSLVGSQLQESSLPDRMRVWEALDLFSTLAPDPVPWESLMDEWGLRGRRNTAFGALSGGQRQRLLVALALVGNPRVVFLDEMTAGLDPAARQTAWRLIDAIRARGTTVVLVTHFMDEAERLCDRIAVMRSGRIVALDSPGALRAAHAGPARIRFTCDEAVDFLGSLPQVESVVQHGASVEVRGSRTALVHVAAELTNRGLEPADLRPDLPTLEDVVLELTGDEG